MPMIDLVTRSFTALLLITAAINFRRFVYKLRAIFKQGKYETVAAGDSLDGQDMKMCAFCLDLSSSEKQETIIKEFNGNRCCCDVNM